MPGLIEFDGNCLIVLSQNLLALIPKECCAVLVGEKQCSSKNNQNIIWSVKVIWPCRNIWNHENTTEFPQNPKERQKMENNLAS